MLQVFADLIELSRNRPAAEDIVDERVHSPREHFHTYLHSLDLARGGLPDSFRTKLARVLAHYGVTDLDRSVALEEAVFRIFLAQQRSAVDVVVVTTLLKAWLSEPRPAPEFEEAARQTLDHVVQATQLRFPVAGDLARSVRFRWFDEPLVDEVRARDVLAGVRYELSYSPRRPRARTAPPGSTRWPRSPNRSCGSCPTGSSTGSPSASRCSRCSPVATTASTRCTTCPS